MNELFGEKPYQGADPALAKFLFIGLDANYSPSVEKSPIFNDLIGYLEDGPRFWDRHGVHHPFLLASYGGDGRFYHKSFARIGFTAKNAWEISFIELIHEPTYGTSQLDVSDLNASHLQTVNRWITHGNAQYIFIPTSVGTLMKESGAFPWMPARPKTQPGHLRLWADLNGKKVSWHYHFSVYGKFEAEKTRQLAEISSLIEDAD